MSETTLTKDEITRPAPGSLPSRISFVEQKGGSAGYYVRFNDAEEPVRKYIPILQHESQKAALQAAIDYRNRQAHKLGLPIATHQGPHTEKAREQMSEHHNRLGLGGLGLSLDNRGGTIYPQLTAMWTGESGQEKRRRGMASRGIWPTVELLAPFLQEHIHTKTSEEELARRGASGVARRLVSIAQDSDHKEQFRRRIKSLLRQWARGSRRDRKTVERVR